MKKYYDTEKIYQENYHKNFSGWNGKAEARKINLSVATSLFFLRNIPIKNILDLGSGGGENAIYFAKLGYNVIGIELSKTAVRLAKENLAKENLQDLNISFINQDIMSHSFKNYSQIDLVFLDSVLHCFGEAKDRQKLYKNLKSLPNPDPYIFISTLIGSEKYPQKYLKKFEQDKNKNLVSFNNYRILFDFDYLVSELEKHGFELISSQIIEQNHENDFMKYANILLR